MTPLCVQLEKDTLQAYVFQYYAQGPEYGEDDQEEFNK